MWFCKNRLKGKTAHFWLPSTSQKRACSKLPNMTIRQASIWPQCNRGCPYTVVSVDLWQVGRFAEKFHHISEFVHPKTSILKPHSFLWSFPRTLWVLKESAAYRIKLLQIKTTGIVSVVWMLCLVHFPSCSKLTVLSLKPPWWFLLASSCAIVA